MVLGIRIVGTLGGYLVTGMGREGVFWAVGHVVS